MIDTHCHLLPRIDDGPRSTIHSIDLARLLVQQGIDAVLCTPHYSARFPTRADTARQRLTELRSDLAELRIPLRLGLAAEVSYSVARSVPAEELQARSVAGFVIVELGRTEPAHAPALAQQRLAEAGLLPVFAHPERSPAILRDPAALHDAQRAGALVQVVISSLAGRRGRDVARAGWALLDAGGADLLASDAHSAAGSAARVGEILEVAMRRYGTAAIDRLTDQTPAKVFEGESAAIG